MNMEERIARINELYHKSQAEGLTAAEKEEQAGLRKEYIESVKGSLRNQLDNVDIKEKDGSITNLGERVQKKKESQLLPVINKKSELRSEFLKKRNSLSKEDILSKSKLIEMRFLNESSYKNAKLILLYASYGSEVHTFGIMEKALEDGKRVAFPKCMLTDGIPSIEFYEVSRISELSDGYKGILEPDTENHKLKKIEEEADICLVPGLVFTRKGQRIGYGKGFYDRYISAHPGILYAGVTYKQQLTHKFETEETDMTVDMVITEENIYVCR